MASPTKNQRTLPLLNTHWNNRSHSTITTTSDAATFHSAHVETSSHIELHPFTTQSSTSLPKLTPSPKLEATKMSRTDSGYSDTPTPHSPTTSSRRTSLSISSTRRNSLSKSKRRIQATNSTNSSRPSTKRAVRSSPQTAQVPHPASDRPSLQSRHTTPYLSSIPSNQFFQFPPLDPAASSPPSSEPTIEPPPPPPTTVQYWTSDSTRRLEYAAIDAASRGVRGFFIKLVPDCILPRNKRRTRFCEGDEGSEAGSVRRYRLELPEEKGMGARVQECRKGFLKRWMGVGKRSS